MLKQRVITLAGRDAGLAVELQELPALVADKYARNILRLLDKEPDEGIAALAYRYAREASQLDAQALTVFVDARIHAESQASQSSQVLDLARDLKDWRSISRLQQAALALHVDFLLDREMIEIPVALRAKSILANRDDARVTFCSSQIAVVLSERLASYNDLETSLSTEDVFNLCEVINVAAIRDWHVQQRLS